MSKSRSKSSDKRGRSSKKPGGAQGGVKETRTAVSANRSASRRVDRTPKTTSSKRAGGKERLVEREGGPRKWLFPILETAYTKLISREQAQAERGAARRSSVAATSGRTRVFRSSLQAGRGEDTLAPVPQDHWVDVLAEYKQRKVSSLPLEALTAARAAHTGPVIPGQKNWTPLGPSVVLNGQAIGFPSIGGRVSGIAIAPGGQTIYAASANGGVFRSDDAGMSWRSLMDAFDLDPTNFASTSLACGAIAIDRDNPDRIYVGTGEGDTYALFSDRIVNALPAYRGIGPIRSDDGGATWISEPTANGSPQLAGKAFFALAVDPANAENVVGATSEGLYQRVSGGSGPEWVMRRPGAHSSVVIASAGGTTRFFAAEWGQRVFESADGAGWSAIGSGFPTTSVGRIALGVQANNPQTVYAFVAKANGALLGVFRLDLSNGNWKRVSSAPNVLPVVKGVSQGDYDLAISVDPADINLVYLGGSYFDDGDFYPASIWRCRVQPTGSGYHMTGDSIGTHAHADVHVLIHAPGDPNSLWAGCDGGVFLNRNPRGSDNFASRNNGLACLCPNFFSQDPTDPNIIICGLQDNGTARTRGGPIWRHVFWGDGGYTLINWATPQQVLIFMNGSVFRATDGGADHDSWQIVASAEQIGWQTMTEPIVSPPYNPSRPADAQIAAVVAGQTVYLSEDFGATWPVGKRVNIPASESLFAIAFASPSRFFVGSTIGEVFRADRAGNSWNVTRLDNATAGPLGLVGLISDVAVDWADATQASVYIAFGGSGDARRVWHFDGTRWEARSGQAGPNKLLNVEHNAMVVDRDASNNIYVGADIGVWHSPDGGQNWFPLPNGLPDAPVFDLQIHPTRRLLRAATHGRGFYEYTLDPTQ
jgi:hypothetical protein